MNFNYILSLFILTARYISSSLIELDYNNYPRVINSKEYAVVLFYETGSMRCAKWENALNSVLRRLELNQNTNEEYRSLLGNVTFAKVDGYKYDEIAETFEIERMPSVKFIQNKLDDLKEITKIIDGDIITEASVINYIKNKISPMWHNITTPEQMIKINRENRINLVLCGYKDKYVQRYKDEVTKVIPLFEDIVLTHITNNTLFTAMKCPSKSANLFLYKKFDEPMLKYSDFANYTVKEWINIYSTPAVEDFTNEFYQLMKEINGTSVVYVYGDEANFNMDKFRMFHKAAMKHRGEFYFTKSALSRVPELKELFDLRKENLPCLITFGLRNETIERSEIMNDLNENNIESMIELLYEQSEGKERVMSEGSNFTNPFYNQNIYKIVTDNYDTEVRAYGRCVLLYGHYNKRSQNLLKMLSELSSLIGDKIKIAIVNLSLNSIPINLDTNSHLNLIKNESTEAFKYEEAITLSNIFKWIKDFGCIEDSDFTIKETYKFILYKYDSVEASSNPLLYLNINLEDELNSLIAKVKQQAVDDLSSTDIEMEPSRIPKPEDYISPTRIEKTNELEDKVKKTDL